MLFIVKLYQGCENMGNIDYTKNPLVKKFIEVETNENKVKNIFLYAGGGYGKTTAMCCLFKYLLDKASNGEKIVPIYIDVKKLNFNEINPIISYIHSEYSGSDTKESDVKNLFSDQSPEFSKKYTYYILIDGLNETNDGNKGNLIDIISRMAEISNVRFVVSSRIKEIFDKAPFCTFEMQKLNEEQIKDYLDKNFGEKYNEQTKVKRINKSLVEILQIPMFMKTFSKTYDKRSPYPDIYDEKTVRKADILDSYVQKILLNLKERTNSYDNNILEFVINFYLTALAFQMAEENVLNIDSEIVDKKLCLDYFLSFFKGTKKEQIKSLINDKKFMPISISSKNFALINDNDGNCSFVHQIWRDFFAAQHIINCMNAEKLDELEISVDENICQFVGELIYEYDADNKYSKEFSYEKKIDANGKIIYVEKPDTRKCECDFEEKDNLETWPESPIEYFMQQHNMNSIKPISSIATRNLIEIMKTCRNNNVTANYSDLNLCECQFRYSNLKNSVFQNTSFKDSTFFISQLFGDGIFKSYCSQKGTIVFATLTRKIVVDKLREEIFEYAFSQFICNIDSLIFDDDNELVIYTEGSTIHVIRISDSNTWQHSIKKPSFCKLLISEDTKTIVGLPNDNLKTIYVLKDYNLLEKNTRKFDCEPEFTVYKFDSIIKSIDLSYDGKYIAVKTENDKFGILNSVSQQMINIDDFNCRYSSLAFSYDNKIIAVSYANTIKLYDFLFEKCREKFNSEIQTKQEIKEMNFKNSNNIFIVSDKEMFLLNISSKIEKYLWEDIYISKNFILIKNNKLIFNDQHFIRILDLNSMRIVKSLKFMGERLLGISSDGQFYFTNSYSKENSIDIRDFNSKLCYSIQLIGFYIVEVKLSNDYRFIAYRWGDYNIYKNQFEWGTILLDINKSKVVKRIPSESYICPNSSFLFSNDGSLFAYMDEKGYLVILDLYTLEETFVETSGYEHIVYFDNMLIILADHHYKFIKYDIESNEFCDIGGLNEALKIYTDKGIINELSIFEVFDTLKISNDLHCICFYAGNRIFVNDTYLPLNCSSNINNCIFKNINYIDTDIKVFWESLYHYGAKISKDEVINTIEESE